MSLGHTKWLGGMSNPPVRSSPTCWEFACVQGGAFSVTDNLYRRPKQKHHNSWKYRSWNCLPKRLKPRMHAVEKNWKEKATRYYRRNLELSRLPGSSSLSSMKPCSRSRLRRLSASATVLRRRSNASLRAGSMSIPTMISPSSSKMLMLSCWSSGWPRRRYMIRRTPSAMRSRREWVCAEILCNGRYCEYRW